MQSALLQEIIMGVASCHVAAMQCHVQSLVGIPLCTECFPRPATLISAANVQIGEQLLSDGCVTVLHVQMNGGHASTARTPLSDAGDVDMGDYEDAEDDEGMFGSEVSHVLVA